MAARKLKSDWDGAWKEALDVYFEAFLLFFFPRIHADIDWARRYEMLDKELQRIVPKAARGRQVVDKLVNVWLKDGQEAWLLIHIEVQVTPEDDFGKRMYNYSNRLEIRYDRPVISIAVLADDDPDWKPTGYAWEQSGCFKRFGFLAVKLLDYATRVDELEADHNPFAKVVLAHLKARETRDNPTERQRWKIRLVRGLYERGFGAEDVRQLLRLIDWLMVLPVLEDREFLQELEDYEEDQEVPFVTSFERIGIEKGILLAIEDALHTKFGEESLALLSQVQALNDAEKYRKINSAIATATSLDDVRAAIAKAAPKRKRGQGQRKPS